MNRNNRTLGVDEHIRDTLREPEHYAFEQPNDERLHEIDDPDAENLPLSKMRDDALEGCIAFYEREHLFGRTSRDRKLAKFELNRAVVEVGRRKAARQYEAVNSALSLADATPSPAVIDADAAWQRATKRAA